MVLNSVKAVEWLVLNSVKAVVRAVMDSCSWAMSDFSVRLRVIMVQRR